MKVFRYISFLFFFLGFFFSSPNISAQKPEIHWISFEQLEDSLNTHPKKVFISFYADWCSYCKKMDRVAFRDPKVISLLNSNYYAVKMDVETRDTIAFEGTEFINTEWGKQRQPIHQIPLLLASRKKKPFSLPATVILDTSFRVKKRYFEYLSPGKMKRILKKE